MLHATDGIQVRLVDSATELEGLADDWERIQRDAAVTSIFASYDWQSLWWRSYGEGHALRVLVATERSEVVGILPLYIRTAASLRYPVRIARFVGVGGDTSPDDLGPVLAASREEPVARALAQAVVAMPGWDVLLLTDMQPESAFTAAIGDEVRARGLRSRNGRSESITFLELPDTWDAWLASLHRDRRYRVRKVRKKLQASHADARFFVWNDASTLDDGVDRLGHLHRKRWQRLGAPHGFSTPQYVGFHRAVMNACFKRDRLRLYCLEVSGEIVAMYYFYKFRDRVYLMQSGFDPDRSELNPGQVLLGHIVEHAIGEGHKVLDFLRGDHRYKDELATGERETVYLTAFRPRPAAWIYEARRIHLPALKASVVQALQRVRPPPAPG
ncbi:MAG: cellulose biosynthesis protein [Labilithrix sp.]|nr:cellulose biosynthesis protein [Labilithrix sp.]